CGSVEAIDNVKAASVSRPWIPESQYYRLSETFAFFFFIDTATTEIYTLSLHDALPIFLIAILPWSVVLLRVGYDAVLSFRQRQWKESNSLFLALWTIFPLVFFSFSQSKLPGYALPVLPPLSALAARSLVLAFQRSL